VPAPAAEYLPATQSAQLDEAVAPVAEVALPAEQAAQATPLKLLAPYHPTAQLVHWEAAAAEYLPVAQLEQTVAAAAE